MNTHHFGDRMGTLGINKFFSKFFIQQLAFFSYWLANHDFFKFRLSEKGFKGGSFTNT